MPKLGAFRSYEGAGTLEYENGESVACEFVATQEEDGGIELHCKTLEPGMPMLWFGGIKTGSKRSRPTRFIGTTANAVRVSATGTLFDVRSTLSTAARSEVTYIVTGDSRLECGAVDLPANVSEFRFVAANLMFDPLFVLVGAGTLPIEIDGVTVTLRRIEGYLEREKVLKRSHGVRVTAEIAIPGALGFEAARDIASDLCDLCSLARGTLVNWICCDALSADGQVAYSFHYPALARPYAGARPLFDPRDSLELKRFLERYLSKYRELRSTREFRTVVHASCEARGGGFIDSRSLVCVSLLEHILGRDAIEHGEDTVLDEELFKSAVAILTGEVAAVMRRVFPAADDDQIAQITNHVQGFNWSSPRRRLKRTAARLELAIPKSEIDAALDTRNDLVHRLTFHTEDRLGEYLRLVWILDLLILGLLGYEGPYLDARDMRPARLGRARG